MNKVDFCYHCHTYRCGHAVGSDEEYVLSAIKNGIKTLWFTDHIIFPDVDQPGIRGNWEKDFLDYIASVNDLKEKYKDQIDIKLGFECEYISKYDSYYKELKGKYLFDHLILGQHFYLNKDNIFERYAYGKDIKLVKDYVIDLIKGMESGYFDFVAHPDLLVYGFLDFTPELEQYTRMICEKAEELQMPLEINLHKLTRRNYLTYPDETFWSIVSEYNIPVLFNGDYHAPEQMDDTDYDYAWNLIEKYHLHFIGHIKE